MKKVVFLAEMVLTWKMVTATLAEFSARNALIELHAYLASADITYHKIAVNLVLKDVWPV